VRFAGHCLTAATPIYTEARADPARPWRVFWEHALSEERPTFVARPSDVEALRASWNRAKDGQTQVVRLQAPFGGGRRALSAELLRLVGETDDDAIVWRIACSDQENGVQWLVRMYGTLIATLTRDTMRRGKVEMVLNAQLPSQPARVQAWYQQFISSMKDAKADKETGQIQLRMPQDNPLVGLVEVVAAIGRKIPILLEIQNPYLTHSLALGMFCEALLDEASSTGSRILQILFDEPASDNTKSSYPMSLLDFYERSKERITVQTLAPWGPAEVESYLASKDKQADAARLGELAKGRPGFVAELVEILEEQGRLSSDLGGVTLADLVPSKVDVDELDIPEKPPKEGDRTHATTDDVGRVTYFAALLGAAFPSNLVADMGGYDRDSVDDLLDAMPDLFEEVQFSNELSTWIYRFKRGSWREAVLERNDTDEGHDLARRVGLFMERYLVPRGYGFVVKTARIYAEHQAYQRAAVVRASALGQDANAVWGMAHDFTRYFDEIEYPDALRRTVSMNLLEQLAGGADLDAAERMQNEVTAWATERDDRELLAWLLLNGSRIDLRRQDLYRARDRANDAFKLYQAMNNAARSAEVKNHVAAIELQDGNLSAALDAANEAEQLGKVKLEDGKEGGIPGIVATVEQIRGLVARRQGKLEDAAEHFRRANEISGTTGLPALALDSGLSYGETLLASRQFDKARDSLERVMQIARSLRNGPRERQATELLAQAEAALRHFDKALPLALRTLELTKALKFDQALPIDLYNVGFFYFVGNKPTEALSYFRQAEDRIAQLGRHPVVKELHYFKGMAHLQAGQQGDAKKSLQTAIEPLKAAKDHRKHVSALEQLAGIEEREGHASAAKELLTEALALASAADLKDERKSLRKRLDALA
jgi:tetratricopeptide (TPR) repeat protein